MVRLWSGCGEAVVREWVHPIASGVGTSWLASHLPQDKVSSEWDTPTYCVPRPSWSADIQHMYMHIDHRVTHFWMGSSKYYRQRTPSDVADWVLP